MGANTSPARVQPVRPRVICGRSALRWRSIAQIATFAEAFLGHVIGAALVALVAGSGSRLVARVAARSAYASAWDHFINACVKQHWVTVGLTNGDAYAG
jgi:hypothetical protein